MQAKSYCKNHGKLEIDEISIKAGILICSKCSSQLEFGVVRPRFDVNGKGKKSKK